MNTPKQDGSSAQDASFVSEDYVRTNPALGVRCPACNAVEMQDCRPHPNVLHLVHSERLDALQARPPNPSSSAQDSHAEPSDEGQQSIVRVPELNEMNMRDYFAAAALSGLVTESGPDYAAMGAYEYADAMLKARIK